MWRRWLRRQSAEALGDPRCPIVWDPGSAGVPQSMEEAMTTLQGEYNKVLKALMEQHFR